MADRYSTVIEIAGKITSEGIRRLATAIYLDGAGPDWDSAFQDESEVEAHIRDVIQTTGEPLLFMAHEVRWGSFSEIEDECRKLGLAFKRAADDGSGTLARPVVPDLDYSCTSDDHEPMLALNELEDLIENDRLQQRLAELRAARDFGEQNRLTLATAEAA